MTRRKTITLVICFFLLFLLGAYVWRWHSWNAGVVMTESRCETLPYRSVVVRELPRSISFWGVVFTFLPHDSFRYRAELHSYDLKTHVSAQSYSGDSFRVRTARVIWDKSGAATVYLGEHRVLTCDKDGFWTKAK